MPRFEIKVVCERMFARQFLERLIQFSGAVLAHERESRLRLGSLHFNSSAPIAHGRRLTIQFGQFSGQLIRAFARLFKAHRGFGNLLLFARAFVFSTCRASINLFD